MNRPPPLPDLEKVTETVREMAKGERDVIELHPEGEVAKSYEREPEDEYDDDT